MSSLMLKYHEPCPKVGYMNSLGFLGLKDHERDHKPSGGNISVAKKPSHGNISVLKRYCTL